MNQKDRNEVAQLVAQLEDLKSQAETIGDRLREMGEGEQEKFDNMPEGLQQGDNGQKMETAAGALSEAGDALQEGNIGEALEALGQIE